MFKKLMIGGLMSFAIISSCGMPHGEMSKDERLHDLDWFIGKIEHNYAPLNYKQDLHGFDWEARKADAIAKASQEDFDNARYYHLVQELIAGFKDGHTSVNQNWDGLPGKLEIAYLGFVGMHDIVNGQDILYVDGILPSFDLGGTFPVQVGDEILMINGKDPYTYARELCPMDVGNELATKRIVTSFATIQLSNLCLLSADEKATLKINRYGQELEIDLSWFRDDYFNFVKTQNDAKESMKGEDSDDVIQIDSEEDEAQVQEIKDFVNKFYSKNSRSLLGFIDDMAQNYRLSNVADLSRIYAFKRLTVNNILAGIQTQTLSDDTDFQTFFDGGAIIPNPSFPVKVYIKPHGLVGYIKIFDFSGDDSMIDDFEQAVENLHDMSVKGIILDLVDNGGGSLDYGLKLANVLKNGSKKQPQISIRFNDNWMNSILSSSVLDENEGVRAINKKLYDGFLAEKEKGQWLSSPFLFSDFGYLQQMDGSSMGEEIQVHIMTNEFCASMCDIFIADLKDNGLATVYGHQTMGAGGNVQQHMSAPNSGMILSLTESLIIRPNGEYLENKGVMPDVPYEQTRYDREGDNTDFRQFVIEKVLEMP